MTTNRCTFTRRTPRTWPRMTDAQVASNLTGIRNAWTGRELTAAEIASAMAEAAEGRRLLDLSRDLLARWQEESDR